ncbi:MAG: isoprenylcysteine carboxylmethyltransferase family protein [Paludibacteraceae bacterium]|jgi:protein-S-isoprenylcysteine O-methyltransferase Ste14|nr:isoprenylcysteine carboxylmethyltransferase family protein [Paludibacteraceae bacterium]
MKQFKNIVGYVAGFMLFICLIPSIMWVVFGRDNLFVPRTWILVLALFLVVGGLCVALWTIIYMKKVGKGNPADAFNHEIAPRTQHLMTDGPYRFCRNPMLFGTLVFYVGIGVWLESWRAFIVPIVFIAILLVQVHFEEKRLEQDFGNEYLVYKKATSRLLPLKYFLNGVCAKSKNK